MSSPANELAGEIAILDEKISVLKVELEMLRQRRADLVDRLGRVLEPRLPVRLTTPFGAVSLKKRRLVTFPTHSIDRDGHDRLVRTIIDGGAWMRLSTVNYPRLKSDWLSDRFERAIREPLRLLAREYEEVVATTPRRSRATGITSPGRQV